MCVTSRETGHEGMRLVEGWALLATPIVQKGASPNCSLGPKQKHERGEKIVLARTSVPPHETREEWFQQGFIFSLSLASGRGGGWRRIGRRREWG